MMPAEFSAYGPLHGAIVLVIGIAIALVVWAGRRATEISMSAERSTARRLAFSVIVVQFVVQIWDVGVRFDPQRTLPLHVCDLVPWIGVAALLTKNRSVQTVAIFWGIGLSVWAFLAPILSVGPRELKFWLFWLAHGQIVAVAVYLAMVGRYRPGARDFLHAVLATLAYTAVILPVDLWLDADYGYVGKRSAVAFLGPWPARVGVLLIGETLVFALLAFALRRRRIV